MTPTPSEPSSTASGRGAEPCAGPSKQIGMSPKIGVRKYRLSIQYTSEALGVEGAVFDKLREGLPLDRYPAARREIRARTEGSST